MIRPQGASELRREKKRSHQWRGVAKIPVAPPPVLLGHCSATRNSKTPLAAGENYSFAHSSEDKG